MIFKLFNTTWNKEEKEGFTIDWYVIFVKVYNLSGLYTFTSV